MKRIQSPSSINTYFQCPRKYFFIYNLKMPTSPSIHLVRGSVAHLVLENLFTLEPSVISDNFKHELKIIVSELLKKYWNENKNDFDKLEMLEEELKRFYFETQDMLLNWTNQFSAKIEKEISKGLTFKQAFEKLKPETEVLYESNELMVRGYIDAIENHDELRLMDYKTSKKPEISKEYRLQLGIYALLYELKHGVKPDKVGIYFLKDTEQLLDVDEDLIQNAKFMIEQIHMSTDGVEGIENYPMKQSPLCKWGSGQCDFYDYCFGGKKIPEKPLR
ncbi:MAG: RecB family exonuclease [Candidatus Woesearchaeota archaeon]